MRQRNPKSYIVLTETGQKPTVPVPYNLTPISKDWKSTDIMIGQSAYNVIDSKWYIRDSSGIVEWDDPNSNYSPSSEITDLFEIINKGLSNEYLRLKRPLAVDYDVQAFSSFGQFPVSIWDSLPVATPTTMGGFKLNSSQFEFNQDNQLTIKSGILTPAQHNHLWADITDKPSTFAPSAHNHSWGEITSGVPSAFTPSAHSLVSSTHTVSGLTVGTFLRATAADAYGFGALTATDVKNVLTDWFELVANGGNPYLRIKYPVGCDYDMQAFTNSGQFASNLWDSLPIASTTSFGIVKIGSGIGVTNGVISVTSGAGMVYPASGIAVSTGTAWGASVVDYSANWNTAYSHSQSSHAYLPLAGGTMSNTNLVTNLNADLLDGYQYNHFLQSNGYLQQVNDNITEGTYYWAPGSLNSPSGVDYGTILTVTGGTGWYNQIAFGTDKVTLKWRSSINNNTSWDAWKNIWNSANDGSGSGLDADMLDSYHITSILASKSMGYSNINANDITELGSYFNMTGEGTGNSNFISGYGFLISDFKLGDNYSHQLGITHEGDVYTRTKWGTWGSWRKYWDSGNSNLSTMDWTAKDLYVNDAISFPTNKASGFEGYSIFQNASKLTIAGGVTSTQFNNNANSAALVSILDGGNVGIGTTTPSNLLTVQSDGASIAVKSVDYEIAYIGNLGSGAYYDYGYFSMKGAGTDKVVFNTAGDSYFNGGNVGIGTTSPDYKLDVNGGIGIEGVGNALYFDTTGYRATNHISTTDDYNMTLYCGRGSTTKLVLNNNGQVELYYGSSKKLETTTGGIAVTGNITATGEMTAYYSSDLRLKKNIQDFSALDIIERLQPKTYNWNDKAKELNSTKDTEINNFGLIAQELNEVLPELVKPIFNKEYLAIDYVQLIPILIQSIKELKTEINTLKNG